MRKKVFLNFFIVALAIIVLFFGYSYFKDKEIAEKAIPIAQHFLEKQYGVEVEFYDYQVNAAYVSSTVILYGRIHDQQEKTFTVFVDYRTYEVSLVSVPVGYDPPDL